MTYREAIKAMLSGKRVRNSSFTSEEYFEMKYGVIVDENGYDMTDWYTGQGWQREGWSVV
jgi:hypothetical protein